MARFEIVHYGIEPGPPPPPLPGAPRLAIVGRLIPIKGHDTLLRALAAVRADLPGVTLEIAGDGALEAELRATVTRLGLDDLVTFLGHVPQVAAVFERAEVVVVPSLGEGFGMVALEAMERGRPVIASAVGGLPEIVDDGRTGLLVPVSDVDALAEAIRGAGGRRDPHRGVRCGREGARARRVLAGAMHGPHRRALPRGARRRRTAPLAEQHPGPLQRERREQREQEVPGRAVAHRAGEHHRGERVVGEQRARRARRTGAAPARRPRARAR